MIVITGPGRSGTSLLARLYQELGFDPTVGGGGWEFSINGGLEDVEVGLLNTRLIQELGMRSQVYQIADRARALRRRASRSSRGETSNGSTRAEKPAKQRSPLEKALMTVAGRQFYTLDWDRVDAVVARHGQRMRDLADHRAVVKDPQFCQTLSVWAAAGADISHVVVSVRSVDATAQRLLDSGHLAWWAERQARNHVVYRLGLLLSALYDHRLSHAIVRFPDFLNEPDMLFDALRFPRPVDRDAFLAVFDAICDPTAVHSWR